MMNKLSVLTVSTLISLSLFPEQIMHAQTGWDPIKAAHVMGAADWCGNNAKSNKPTYQSLSKGASRILKQFIETGKITRSETDLVTARIQEQGYYLGRKLSDTECTNLSSIVTNVRPWELITSAEERFVIEMPDQPTRKETANEIQGQQFRWVEYEALLEPAANLLLEKSEYYLVAYTKMPKAYASSKNKDEIFDAFSQFIFQEMGLPELKKSEREITPDGVTARLASGDGYGQSVTTVMYIVDDRFYLTLIVSQKPEHFERFLRSFEILDFTDQAASTSKD